MMDGQVDGKSNGGPLRTAIVGCGLAANELHLPALAALPGVEVTGVCDRDQERARHTAERFQIEGVFDDPERMLSSLKLDNLHILTPPESHADLACLGMEHGAHVLIEKPFAYTTQEADRVLAMAERTQRSVSVIHDELFYPAVDELRGRLASGEVGEICWLHYISARRDQTFVPDEWYYSTHGGRFGETLPHALCLLVEMLEELEVRHVEARSLGHTEIPADFRVAAGFDELRVLLSSQPNNALAEITYSFNSKLPTSLIVAGTEGSLIARPFEGVQSLSTPASLKENVVAVARQGKERIAARIARGKRPSRIQDSGHYRQIEGWLKSIRGGTEPPVTARSAREVVRLWQAIVERYA